MNIISYLADLIREKKQCPNDIIEMEEVNGIWMKKEKK